MKKQKYYINTVFSVRSFLSDKFKKKDVNNILLSKSDSDEIIPQSSEEKLIPCTSKVKDTKMLLKKKNVNISNMNTKTGELSSLLFFYNYEFLKLGSFCQ